MKCEVGQGMGVVIAIVVLVVIVGARYDIRQVQGFLYLRCRLSRGTCPSKVIKKKRSGADSL